MKKIGYKWLVVKNTLALLVIIGAFSNASADFETTMIAGLVLIYLSVESFFMLWAESQLGKAPSSQDKEAFDRYCEVANIEEKKMLINSGFVLIAYVIALAMLVVAILN